MLGGPWAHGLGGPDRSAHHGRRLAVDLNRRAFYAQKFEPQTWATA